MRKLPTILLLLAVISTTSTYCLGQTTPQGQHSNDPQATDPIQVITSNEKAEREAFKDGVRALVLANDFEKLEQKAEELRKTKDRFSNGYLKLRAFYMSFAEFPAAAPDEDWLTLIAAVEKWDATFKDAPTPKIALAETYRGYAWKARTSQYADKVSEEGWKKMSERLQKTNEALSAAKSLPKQCPGWYGAAQRYALGAQMPRLQYDNLFEMGVKNAPFYDAIYDYRAYYLFPRWYGEPGEWEKFAIDTMKRSDIPESSEVFAKIALYLNGMGYLFQEYSGSEASWTSLKESFIALQKHYPNSLEIQSLFLRTAAASSDYQEARKQLKLVGNRFDTSCWETTEQFKKMVTWCGQPDEELESAKAAFRREHP